MIGAGGMGKGINYGYTNDRCGNCNVARGSRDSEGNVHGCHETGKCTYDRHYRYSASPSYIEQTANSKKEKEEDNKMSFVGLQFNKKEKKIIAFADTKSTKFNESGLPVADKEPVHKIFFSDKFVMVSYGQNEYSDKNGKICPIKDLIFSNMTNLQTAFEVLRESYSKSKNAKTGFIMGKQGVDEVIYVEVNGESIIEERKKIRKDVLTVYGGQKEYIHVFDRNSKLNQLDGLGLKRELEGMVEFFDKHVDYNYVGGEIESLEWDWNWQ